MIGGDVELREIRTFLVLAEELHFGRTAERLLVTPSRVSQTISTLERRIGTCLFHRTSRAVRLTPAGEQLRDRLRPVYAELLKAISDVRAAAAGVTGQLRVGCLVTAGGQALTLLAAEFCARYPDCDLTLHTVETRDPYTPLRRNVVDVLVSYLVVDEPDLTAGPVIEYRHREVAVARTHRLAARESVSVEDLADEHVHQIAPAFPAALYDAIAPRVTPAGRPIHRTYPWESDEDVLTAVARGRIVHPEMSGTALTTRPDLVLIPIDDLPPMPLGLIWCTAHENSRIRALADTARQVGPSSGSGHDHQD